MDRNINNNSNNINNNKNNSVMFSWNFRGIRNKKSFLENPMWEYQPLLVAAQEIKLKTDTNFNPHISNYSYIDQRLETEGNAAGGVGFYIHKDVVHHRIKLKTKFQSVRV